VRTLADAQLVLTRPVLKKRPLEVLALARSVESHGAAEVVVRATPGLKVMGDANAAQRILENLVASAAAVQAAASDGAVAVGAAAQGAAAQGAAAKVRTAQVEIDAELVRGGSGLPVAAITVSYAGTAPDEGTAARMFEPFFFARPGASGIGLYAAKVLAISMGWDVSVASAENGRTGFAVTAPLC
jgi:signal transduction histidine kinase